MSRWPEEDDQIQSFEQLRQKLTEIASACRESIWYRKNTTELEKNIRTSKQDMKVRTQKDIQDALSLGYTLQFKVGRVCWVGQQVGTYCDEVSGLIFDEIQKM